MNTNKTQITYIPIDNLYVSDKNVRKDLDELNEESNIMNLSQNIKEHGLISPLCVRQTDDNKYEIFAGQRRYLAIKLIGWKEVPCIVYDKNISDEEIIDISFSENIHRIEMSQKDKINYYDALYKHLGTIEEVSKKINVSENTIKKYLRLKTGLSQDVIEQLDNDNNKINLQIASTLTKVKKDQQLSILNDISTLKTTKEKMDRLSMIVDFSKRTRKRSSSPSASASVPSDQESISPIHEEDKDKPWIYDKNGKKLLIPEPLFNEILDLINDYKFDNYLD
jgi:ParB family chromosome partitioning protein